jgi:2,4-dienoyl-CoA reductase-like NADH-dependent reductase (Old Yellow Enzyme family)
MPKESTVSVLFQPQRIGRIEIRNRLVRSATYYGLADERGRVGDASVELMKTLAGNAVGLIITGYAFVARSGQVFPDMNGIDSDEQIPGYRRMTRAVHHLRGRIVMQIAHGGVASAAAVRRGEPRLAVSADENPSGPRDRPREITEEEIETIVDDFGRAARRVEEAGFDGVQIHGAHGYLVTQFLSPRSNRRTDRWGGSLENRMRFAVEVVRAMRRQVDRDFPLMIKLGCRDYLDDGPGMTIEEGARVAAALQEEGVCFVEVSHGMPGRSFRKMSHGKEKAPIREAYLLPDARVVRAATSVPLAVVGGMRSLPVMEEAIASGAVDCVSLCRPLIREPDLVKRWLDGDTRPADCLSCGACLKTDEEGKGEIRCRQLRPAPVEA